jgi:UDP-GlcNAc:undecaprenyl-phosphate/decaprenyl-phosphate GlcNAc-1-phosphate transferase
MDPDAPGISFAIAALLAGGMTPIWIAIAERCGLVAAPNPIVVQHRRPTAHMGGIAVAIASYAAILITCLFAEYFSQGTRTSVRHVAALLPAGLAFLLLGAIDDLLTLSPPTKLVGQIASAVLAAGSGLVYPFTAQADVDFVLAVASIVTVVNAVNLTDVCDGLVSGLSLISLLAWAIVDPALATWGAAAAGACFGFLIFNAPPARVFLGDAGSHWLGFMLIGLSLAAAPHGPPARHAATTVLVCAVFLFELGLLIAIRSRKGIPFWRGSPDHFSLRLQAAGLSRRTTLIVSWTVSTLLVLTAVWL